MSANQQAVVAATEALVKEHMSKYDPSHDWYHVNRVRNTALRIARSLNPTPDLHLTELLALCHDLDDHKYSTGTTLRDTLTPLVALPETGCEADEEESDKITPALAEKIIVLVPLISWSTEKKLRAAGTWNGLIEGLAKGEKDVLFAVQDADRLDAIGAFGILRVAAYSSATSRPLHVPSILSNSSSASSEAELLRQQIDSSAIQHFHDKLLLVKDRMKTEWGKREAEKRHATMLTFLAAIDDEYGQ